MDQTSTDITQIAQKKRHLHLLEKVRANTTLSKSELAELQRYERLAADKVTEPAELPEPGRGKQKAGKKVDHKPGARLPITAAEVCRLGLEYDTWTEAEAAVRLPGRFSTKKPGQRLIDVFEKFPQLRDAWDRGRFLRKLRGQAKTLATVSQAAKRLGLASGNVLRKMIESDPEVGDLWNQTKDQISLDVKTAFIDEAKGGNAAAIRAVENILLVEKERPAFDPCRVTNQQLIEITGKSRSAVHDWRVKYGLQRNTDKTFDLSVFLAWYEEFLIKRTPNGYKVPAVNLDPLRAVRAEKLRVELETHRNLLLDRDRVVLSLCAWAQNIVTFCDRGIPELAKLCASQPREKIVEIAGKFFEDLHSEASKVPRDLNFTEEKEKELTKFLLSLRPQGDGCR